jgi:hypothetical protein
MMSSGMGAIRQHLEIDLESLPKVVMDLIKLGYNHINIHISWPDLQVQVEAWKG